MSLGKNDGSVGGVRYFQTSEKRGVFIRPEKLEILSSVPSPTRGPSSVSSPPPASPVQRPSDSGDDTVRVNDTVLYNGKVGTVRFVGTTEFKVTFSQTININTFYLYII